MRDKLEEKGRALATEWIGPECREFIVGFEKGYIEVYRAETNQSRAVRTINFKQVRMNSLELTCIQRPTAHYFLVIILNRDMTGAELERQTMNERNHEDSIMNGEQTEIVVKKGDLRFEEEIRVDKKFFEKRDSIFLASAGIFHLYEKYYTLSKLSFKRPRQPTDS